MASEKMERRLKIYELSVTVQREKAQHLMNVVCNVCEHGLWILSQNHTKRYKTCVFCGQKIAVPIEEKEFEQCIDATVLGRQLTCVTVDKIRALVMKKLCQDEEITVDEFSATLKLTKNYSDSHLQAGLFEYFEKILPPPKVLVMANEFAGEEAQRIWQTLHDAGFRINNDYGEVVDLEKYDALIVVNSDVTIDGKEYPSYISDDMDAYIRYAMHKNMKVFFTHPLPEGMYSMIRKPLLPTDYFFLHNVLARK